MKHINEFLQLLNGSNAESIRLYLAQNNNLVSFSREDQITALVMAARYERLEAINTLLKSGIKVDSVDKHGWTALLGAVAEGRLEAVELLLRSGADINYANNNGDTALIIASSQKQTNVIKLLLKFGADANIVNKNNNIALTEVMRTGFSHSFKDLLNAGSDPLLTIKDITMFNITLSYILKQWKLIIECAEDRSNFNHIAKLSLLKICYSMKANFNIFEEIFLVLEIEIENAIKLLGSVNTSK